MGQQGLPGPGPVPVMPAAQRPSSGHQHERSFSHGSIYSQNNTPLPQTYSARNSAQSATIPSSRFNSAAPSAQGPPQLGALSFQSPQSQQRPSQPQLPSPQAPQNPLSQNPLSQNPLSQNPLMQHPAGNNRPGSSGPAPGRNQPVQQMMPTRPVFGISLSRLYERDSLAVPMVLYQCIQAVDLYGLTVEGIYRLSGSVPHVNKLKGLFDAGTIFSLLARPPRNLG